MSNGQTDGNRIESTMEAEIADLGVSHSQSLKHEGKLKNPFINPAFLSFQFLPSNLLVV